MQEPHRPWHSVVNRSCSSGPALPAWARTGGPPWRTRGGRLRPRPLRCCLRARAPRDHRCRGSSVTSPALDQSSSSSVISSPRHRAIEPLRSHARNPPSSGTIATASNRPPSGRAGSIEVRAPVASSTSSRSPDGLATPACPAPKATSCGGVDVPACFGKRAAGRVDHPDRLPVGDRHHDHGSVRSDARRPAGGDRDRKA